MLADGLEELADEALRRPIGETDLPAVLADANQLGGGTLLVAGVSAPAESATRAAFAQAHLVVIDRTERDDWVALALRR